MIRAPEEFAFVSPDAVRHRLVMPEFDQAEGFCVFLGHFSLFASMMTSLATPSMRVLLSEMK